MGETNASPSSWGVRQNSFHRSSCGGLQNSPELPPLLSWEAKACHLAGSRENRGSSQAQTPLEKGLTDVNLAFGFAKRG